MAASKVRYQCDGFDLIAAANITHAAQLFAVRIARQKYGPQGRCTRLKLCEGLCSTRAVFEAFVGVPKGVAISGQTCRFVVNVLHGELKP